MVLATHAWLGDSDGAVLTFPCPALANMSITDEVGLDEWVWVHADGTVTALDPEGSLEIECNLEPAACNTSCLVPRCGDGNLDVGEACDDGNEIDDETCAGDCTE